MGCVTCALTCVVFHCSVCEEPDVAAEWQTEGRRLVPTLPRHATHHTSTAHQLPRPDRPANLRSAGAVTAATPAATKPGAWFIRCAIDHVQSHTHPFNGPLSGTEIYSEEITYICNVSIITIQQQLIVSQLIQIFIFKHNYRKYRIYMKNIGYL